MFRIFCCLAIIDECSEILGKCRFLLSNFDKFKFLKHFFKKGILFLGLLPWFCHLQLNRLQQLKVYDIFLISNFAPNFFIIFKKDGDDV